MTGIRSFHYRSRRSISRNVCLRACRHRRSLSANRISCRSSLLGEGCSGSRSSCGSRPSAVQSGRQQCFHSRTGNPREPVLYCFVPPAFRGRAAFRSAFRSDLHTGPEASVPLRHIYMRNHHRLSSIRFSEISMRFLLFFRSRTCISKWYNRFSVLLWPPRPLNCRISVRQGCYSDSLANPSMSD